MRLTTLFCLSTALSGWLCAQDAAPTKILSPDGKSYVEISDTPLPGADSLDDFTLIISANGKVLTKVPTYGFLLAAHWSSDGKYLAVNNRRGNSGDYIWVFNLQSGKALKQPDDKNGEAWEKAAGEAVHKELPSASEDTLVRDWVTAQGWKDGQLKVVVRSVYRGANKKFDLEMLVDPADLQIKNSKLVKRGLEE